MGESTNPRAKLRFDRRIRLEFHGATITSDAGLLACRELDDALGLTETANECLQESRGGRNVQHRLVGLLRQSVYSRLAGYEDTNDAERLSDDPTMRVIVGRRGGPERPAASCNCSAIMSSLTVKGKCPHEGACDIDAERADKASGSQQFDGGPYDHGAGSDFDGSERAPHQAYSGGLQQGGSSRTRSRQSRSQTGQRYIGPVGDRRGGPGADPIRGSQPHAPERVAEGARGHRPHISHINPAGRAVISNRTT